MDLSRLDDVHIAMRLAGIRPDKGLGQHFLIDRDALNIIVSTGEITKDDVVLEIGPGLGVMTSLLCEGAKKVVAVEADAQLSDFLGRQAPANLEVYNQDIMRFDLSQLGNDYKVVANLPYYLTSAILRLLMESKTPPKLMSLLIQKEVAERIVAEPGNMSILALSIQYYASASIVGIVERHKFWPAPKIDSAIIRVERLPKPAFDANPDKLFRLIKAGFGEKRKQLKNSLAGGLNTSVDVSAGLLASAKIAPQARAQELTMKEWKNLYTATLKKELI